MGAASGDEEEARFPLVDDGAGSRIGDGSSDEESESDDEGGLEGTRAKVSVKELLEIILKDIQSGDLDLTNEKKLQAFETGDGEILASVMASQRQPTVLHIMAMRDKKELPKLDSKMEPLIRFLAKHKNDILRFPDPNGHTSLYHAIEMKKEKMVQWMCDAHPNISAILAIQSLNHANCIHIGIEKKVKFLDLLIDKADSATLTAKNSDGNTPLHLAVEYKRCKKEQLAIIERIVAKSDCGLQQDGSAPNDFNQAEKSPFMHHKETVAIAKAKEADKAEREARKQAGDMRPPDKHPGHAKADPGMMNGAAREVAAPGQKTNPLSGQEPARPEKGRTLHVDTRSKYGGRTSGSEASNTQAISAPTLPKPSESSNEAKKPSRPQDGSKTRDAKVSAEAPKSRVDEATVKSVERFLKLHYLRSRSYSAALEILYGRDVTSDLELFFDLSGHADLKQTGLESLLSKLKFEEILQYIAIPKLSVETNVVTANSRKLRAGTHVKQDGLGRRDLCAIFKRLREQNVKTILKVIVDDMASPAHSDEAIEEALRSFDVEIWDWKRVDLCSEVIYRASSKVREVHLYWSGNNAVLRGWADEGGLKKLRDLRTVHLHVEQGLETSVRIKQYVDEFCEQLKRRCPLVTIEKPPVAHRKLADLSILRADEQGEHPPKHEWMHCMREFRKFLYNAESYYQGPPMHKSIKERITVALIDDGADVKDLEMPLSGGQTFCTRDRDQNLNAPFYVSSMGHGTIMARQIDMICPRAELYVLRLEDYPTEEGTRQITAKSAAKAITAAVNKGVHIISMSWTIDPPLDDADDKALNKAITAAAAAGILMFCSASDKGAKTGPTYPAKATNKIITIGAAKASGAADPWIGNPNNINFTLPGVKVEQDGERSGGDGDKGLKEATGSSVATALAAGLAALVLYCVQVRILLARNKDDKEKAEKDFSIIKKHDGMMKALKDIGTTDESGGKYIEVWDLFGKKIEENRPSDPERWIEVIGEIGATLCRKL